MIEFLPHTADIRVRITAPTLEALFAEAMLSLAQSLAPQDRAAERVSQRVTIESSDRTSLLIDFLNEVLGHSLVGNVVFESVTIDLVNESAIDATITGNRATLGEEVKAVTYHEAEVRQQSDGSWTTLLVFDI